MAGNDTRDPESGVPMDPYESPPREPPGTLAGDTMDRPMLPAVPGGDICIEPGIGSHQDTFHR